MSSGVKYCAVYNGKRFGIDEKGAIYRRCSKTWARESNAPKVVLDKLRLRLKYNVSGQCDVNPSTGDLCKKDSKNKSKIKPKAKPKSKNAKPVKKPSTKQSKPVKKAKTVPKTKAKLKVKAKTNVKKAKSQPGEKRSHHRQYPDAPAGVKFAKVLSDSKSYYAITLKGKTYRLFKGKWVVKLQSEIPKRILERLKMTREKVITQIKDVKEVPKKKSSSKKDKVPKPESQTHKKKKDRVPKPESQLHKKKKDSVPKSESKKKKDRVPKPESLTSKKKKDKVQPKILTPLLKQKLLEYKKSTPKATTTAPKASKSVSSDTSSDTSSVASSSSSTNEPVVHRPKVTRKPRPVVLPEGAPAMFSQKSQQQEQKQQQQRQKQQQSSSSFVPPVSKVQSAKESFEELLRRSNIDIPINVMPPGNVQKVPTPPPVVPAPVAVPVQQPIQKAASPAQALAALLEKKSTLMGPDQSETDQSEADQSDDDNEKEMENPQKDNKKWTRTMILSTIRDWADVGSLVAGPNDEDDTYTLQMLEEDLVTLMQDIAKNYKVDVKLTTSLLEKIAADKIEDPQEQEKFMEDMQQYVENDDVNEETEDDEDDDIEFVDNRTEEELDEDAMDPKESQMFWKDIGNRLEQVSQKYNTEYEQNLLKNYKKEVFNLVSKQVAKGKPLTLELMQSYRDEIYPDYLNLHEYEKPSVQELYTEYQKTFNK